MAALGLLCWSGSSALAREGDPVRLLTASQFYELVLRDGAVQGPVRVDEDIDLSRLVAPKSRAAGAILFKGVFFRGRLYGAPRHPLQFDAGAVCTLDGERKQWINSVGFRETRLGRLSFSGARFGADFTCIACRVCQAGFEEAQFGGEVTLTGSQFSSAEARAVCARGAPRCLPADFSEAVFASTARFDRAAFQGGASFHGAEFRSSARFTAASAAGALSFVGARLRGHADFRGCMLAAADFGAGRERESSEFGAMADFRGCNFKGPVRFDDAVFLGEAVFSGTRFEHKAISFRGAVASRSIDVRATQLAHPQAHLLLNAIAADSIKLSWDDLGPAVRRGAFELERPERIAMFETLSRRLELQGATRAAREVAFEAQHERRAQRSQWCAESVGACIAGEAEWWLWTLPTQNGGDPTLMLAALAALWAFAAGVSLARGRVVVLPRTQNSDPGPVYALVLPEEMPADAYYPIGARRMLEVARFATKLVLKLGGRHSRIAAPAAGSGRAAAAALWIAWLLGWALLAATAAVLAASFPGLGFLKGAI